MARLALGADGSLCHTTRRVSIFNSSSKQYFLNVIPFKHKHTLRFKLSCRVKEKELENLLEVQKKLNGVQLNGELDQKGELLRNFEDELEDGNKVNELGLEWNWPPWKNIPQRYKLVGTTSLAFVICNMDKVSGSSVLFFFLSIFVDVHVLSFMCNLI